jgi:hypothetical protein
VKRVLVVHPGACVATHDVHMGVVDGLRANGVHVEEFRLDMRIERANGYLHYLWRQQKKAARDRHWPKPSPGDVLYQATVGIVERAIERNCQDVIIVSAMYLLPDRIELARRAGLRVWMLCTETPYEMENETRLSGLVDGVWTHERAVLEHFRAANANTGYLPHGWRRGVHDACDSMTSAPASDVLFVGSFFKEREQFFEAIDWTGIDLALYGSAETISKKSPLKKFVRGGLTRNEDVVGLARGARVVLNVFRKPGEGSPAESLNPRCYEMAAAGVCFVSDERAEVVERFGDAVPTFTTPEEAGAVLRALLADPARREYCREKARWVVALDSWNERARQMIADIEAWRQAPRKE